MESRLRRQLRPHVASGPQRARTPRSGGANEEHTPKARVAAGAARARGLLRFTRYGVPALIVLAGIVAMCFGTETSLVGGAGLIGAGLASWLISWLYRLGVSGDDARASEERARQRFERTGRWPDS